MDDLVYRREAVDALWKALYEYEDKTESQFAESEELDLSEWMLHRIFVQNMNDIDRQTILELRSAGSWKKGYWETLHKTRFSHVVRCSVCGRTLDMHGVNAGRGDANFCPNCGADMRGETDG